MKIHVKHELVLERRPLGLLPGERGTPVAPLAVPATMPEATKENSWVTFEPADRRFLFRHPQDLVLQGQGGPAGWLEIRFKDERPTGRAALSITVPTRTSVASVDGLAHDPASLKKTLDKQWDDDGVVATKGQAEWLPDEDWKELKRRVYRLEASLKIEGRERPVFADHYLVEFNRTQNILVFSWTERADHIAYRTQAEEIIKSFQLGNAEKLPNQPGPLPASTAPGADLAPADAPGATPATDPAAPASAPTTPPR
jgi:hypothetical protein